MPLRAVWSMLWGSTTSCTRPVGLPLRIFSNRRFFCLAMSGPSLVDEVLARIGSVHDALRHVRIELDAGKTPATCGVTDQFDLSVGQVQAGSLVGGPGCGMGRPLIIADALGGQPARVVDGPAVGREDDAQ